MAKEKDIYCALMLYRELGYYLTRREEYERALRYFDEALEREPKDRRSLFGRAYARAKVIQYQGSMDDLAKILEMDPGDLIAIAQQALNTYLCCEFEDALVLNTRMVPFRTKPDDFVMGVMCCTEAIQNCVGTRAGRPLRDYFKIIRRLAWKKCREAEKPFVAISRHKKKKRKFRKKKVVLEPVMPNIRMKMRYKKTKNTKTQTEDTQWEALSVLTGVVPSAPEEGLDIVDSLNTLKTESDNIPRCKPYPYRPMQRYTSNIQNYMSEKYLDSMYRDKIFLRDMKGLPGVLSPNKEGTKKIKKMSKEGFKLLSFKQELLRTRRPFYNIKYQEARLSPAILGRMAIELRKMQRAAIKDADKLLNNINLALSLKQTRVALELIEKLKIYCDLKPRKVLPTWEIYLNHLYSLSAYAYFMMFRLNPNALEFQTRKRIINWFGMPLSRQPSQDSVANQFKDVFIDWKKEILVYEERLRKAFSNEEMAWCYYELARHHMEVKQYELARVYSRKCITETRNPHWVINAMMAIARTNLLQHNRNDTKTQLQEVILACQQLQFPEVEEFVTKCLEVVDTIEGDEFIGLKVLERREQQIIQMMAGIGMKDEVAFLFRKMGAMPTTRRMSVMPGVRLEEDQKITASMRKMSIMPGAKQPEDNTPRLPPAGGKPGDQEEGREGIAFMDLIKYHVD